jgi:DNA-binding transcriptional ArsR family regulator
MSPAAHEARLKKRASVFAALGDETRLKLVDELSRGQPRSITSLSEGAKITRQAITKHLRVLEGVGLVRNVKSGRESLFEFNPKPLGDAEEALQFFSKQWDGALSKLKKFIEKQV